MLRRHSSSGSGSDSDSGDSTRSDAKPDHFEAIPMGDEMSERRSVSRKKVKALEEYLKDYIYYKEEGYEGLGDMFESQLGDLRAADRVGYDGFLYGPDCVGEECDFKIDRDKLDDWSYHRIFKLAKRLFRRVRARKLDRDRYIERVKERKFGGPSRQF